ncbi:Hypothetical protein A7982_04555 [Minicystis rosea]|nr:Hypothetical protein A7982_04555 [Minicystis rosea]
MTIVLGFGVLFQLEVLVGERGALDVARALARHSPEGRLRFERPAEDADKSYELIEIDREGRIGPPQLGDDLDDIDLVTRDLFEAWPSDDPPLFMPFIVLPQQGWDWDALRREPAIAALVAPRPSFHWFGTITDAYDLIDSNRTSILDVASVYDIALIFS